MSTPEPTAVERLAILVGLGTIREVMPLEGGSNNRVYRVEAQRGRALLKSYYHHPGDPRDRLGAEFAFSRFAWSVGVRCIPRLLVADPGAKLGLFEFVEGERPAVATASLIEQSIEFVQFLNAARRMPLAARLPLASEACFSIEEHLGTVARRVGRLAAIVPESDLHCEALRLVATVLSPAWKRVARQTRILARDNRVPLDQPIHALGRCISPSDFGFHNAVIGPDGRATFLDFEYAGWDDPAKLICDYFCQPTVSVPIEFLESFAHAVSAGLPDPDSIVSRARLLLPVYRLKWVCIRLNEFLPTGHGRRRFATKGDLENRKCRQLALAAAALDGLVDRERIPA